MNLKTMVLLVTLAGTGLAVSAQGQTAPTQYVTPTEAVTFTPLDPAMPDGVNLAVLSGKPQGGGAVTLLLRIPKGPAPIHTHSAGYYGVVVRGQARHWPAGQEAPVKPLNPGSHWYQPGKAPHGDECLSDQCLLLLQMEGPYDFAPVAQ